MQTQKLSLANIKGKLSRLEIKSIMAGLKTGPRRKCCIEKECTNCSENADSCEPKATPVPC